MLFNSSVCDCTHWDQYCAKYENFKKFHSFPSISAGRAVVVCHANLLLCVAADLNLTSCRLFSARNCLCGTLCSGVHLRACRAEHPWEHWLLSHLGETEPSWCVWASLLGPVLVDFINSWKSRNHSKSTVDFLIRDISVMGGGKTKLGYHRIPAWFLQELFVFFCYLFVP